MNSFFNWVSRNSSKILTGVTISGITLTGILSFRAGTKASRIIDNARIELESIDSDDKEYKREIILDVARQTAPSTIPAAVVLILTIICCIKNQSMNTAKIKSLSTLVGISTKQLVDVNAELIETFGEKKAKEIRGKAVRRRFEIERPNNGNQYIYIQDCGGNTFCGDTYTQTFWLGEIEQLNQSIRDLAYDCADLGHVTLNDLYIKNGCDYCPIAETIVWTLKDLRYEVDNFGNRIPKLPIETTSFIAKFNNKPCVGLLYNINT